ncbi:MAG: hypothetical protein ACREDK_05620 [Thermoplasmata archaeon]
MQDATTVEASGRPRSPEDRPTIARADLLLLGALLLAVVFIALEPLLTFSLFGSDTGEYYRLTTDLIATGHLPIGGAYTGWGSAYPDFPGLFLLSGGVAGALGATPLSALTVAVPAVSALSTLPLFLLFRRIVPHDRVAILGAGFATFAMPRMFSLAHPAPLGPGDFLVVAALWMFVEGRRDVRWYLPLTLSAAALIVTHHLSSYFFAVSALGGLVALELWRPGAWSRRFPTRELLFTGAFLLATLAFWIGYAVDFSGVLAVGTYGLPPTAVEAGLMVAGPIIVVLAGALVHVRRGRARASVRPFVRLPSDGSVVRDLAIVLVAEMVGVAALLVVALPGTQQTTSVWAIVYFLPLLIAIPCAAGTRRLVAFNRLGPLAVTWLLAIGLSAIFALATNNLLLEPSRHPEYLLIPMGLLIALGLGRALARLGDRAGRPAVIAGALAVVVLLGANAAIAYPPPSDFGGFQEGLTHPDAAMWLWAGVGLPAGTTLASDHRLSSMFFGFDGLPATWDSTPALFTGSSRTVALGELASVQAPHAGEVRPINAVAVDATMLDVGVALDPNQLAAPMSPAAVQWLGEPPFVPVYENGASTIYWVDGPIGP